MYFISQMLPTPTRCQRSRDGTFKSRRSLHKIPAFPSFACQAHHTGHTIQTNKNTEAATSSAKLFFSIAMSFSFSHIPIGLGLATAAHIHLCRNNLVHAERLRQRHHDYDLKMRTLSDMVVLTEVIELLDNTIDSISSTTQRPSQRSRRTNTSRAYRKEKRGKSEIKRLNENQIQAPVWGNSSSLAIPLELSAGMNLYILLSSVRSSFFYRANLVFLDAYRQHRSLDTGIQRTTTFTGTRHRKECPSPTTGLWPNVYCPQCQLCNLVHVSLLFVTVEE